MANVLLLGPDRARVGGVRTLLRQDGHRVACLRTVEQWPDAETDMRPDLIVAAVENTDDVMDVHGRTPSRFPAPLLFVQDDEDFGGDLYLPTRLVDRLASPFLSEELLARVDALIRVRRVILHEPSARGADDDGASKGALRGRLAALLGRRVPRFAKPLGPYLEVAARLSEWADRRDAFEPGHAERVASVCAIIAEALHLGADETSTLMRAAMLHDIGKIALPVEMLNQKAPLEESQRRLIRTHPKRGAALLAALDGDDEVATTVLYHHERPDGEGYYGLAAEDMPVTARILALAEIYDAMTSTRLSKPVPSQQALSRLSEVKGETVDADCVDALVDRLRTAPQTIPLAPSPY